MLSNSSSTSSTDSTSEIGDILDPKKHTLPTSWLKLFANLAQPAISLGISKNALTFLQNPDLHIVPESSRLGEEEGNEDSVSWGSSPSSPVPGFPAEQEDSTSEDESVDIHRYTSPLVPPELWEDVDKLKCSLNKAIVSLGGAVIPKVDAKAPKDARWLALNKSLRCQSAEEVLLLLKHSNIIDQVLDDPVVGAPLPRIESYLARRPRRHSITLFKWDDLFGPEYEFRCFVVNKKLVLITQRDENQAYPAIMQDRDGIIQDIHAFFRQHIYGRFPLNKYIFDVIRTLNRIVLIDFNIFGPETEPSLTSYEELTHLVTEMENNLTNGGIGRGLMNTEKYGEPYFRYATEAVIASSNPDLQCPLPLEMNTCVLQIPASEQSNNNSLN